MNDLAPMPRLTPRQLKALAVTVRNQSSAGDRVADSVAAALESVSRHRETPAWLLAAKAGASLVTGAVRSAVNVGVQSSQSVVDLFLPPRPDEEERQVARLVDASRLKTVRYSGANDWHPDAIRTALLAVERGAGLLPDQYDALATEGWVEWVDGEYGSPVYMNDPRSFLRLTRSGNDRLTSELIASSI